jgi:hypothetical protein
MDKNSLAEARGTEQGCAVREQKVSAKLERLFPPQERCPSGLRSTLGKRV